MNTPDESDNILPFPPLTPPTVRPAAPVQQLDDPFEDPLITALHHVVESQQSLIKSQMSTIWVLACLIAINVCLFILSAIHLVTAS